jgi:cytoskeletal protein CcmA (bactofilin family)
VLRRLSSAAALLALLAMVVPTSSPAVGAGSSEDAIVVISGDVTVDRGDTVEGVFIASGDARIEGRVDGDVAVLSGDVVVTGTIDGDLFTASGRARLGPTAEVTGDVNYGDERPIVSPDARVHGDVQKEGWPDLGGLLPLVGGFLIWLAVGISMLVLGGLLLLIAPRAADALEAQRRERVGPVIAIGIAILIVLPIAAVIAAITLLGLPLAILVGLALLPLGAVAYVTTAYAVGRALVKPPRERLLSFLAGLAVLRLLALVPILGLLVGLAAVVFGLGLIGAAIGAARGRDGEAGPTPPPAQSPGS